MILVAIKFPDMVRTHPGLFKWHEDIPKPAFCTVSMAVCYFIFSIPHIFILANNLPTFNQTRAIISAFLKDGTYNRVKYHANTAAKYRYLLDALQNQPLFMLLCKRAAPRQVSPVNHFHSKKLNIYAGTSNLTGSAILQKSNMSLTLIIVRLSGVMVQSVSFPSSPHVLLQVSL
jgi:hypothetical protein